MGFPHRLPLLLAALLCCAAPILGQTTGAQCTVTFETTWSAATHPVDFPGGSAHYSQLIGATHNDGVVFWQPGDFASAGIQSVAETGATATFEDEIELDRIAGFAAGTILGPTTGTPNTVSTSFAVGISHPRVTLVTMIAPSPDWFVGVHGELLFEDGTWNTMKVVDLPAYDAGTDSGTTYNATNLPTAPADPIARVTDPPLDGAPSLGTFTFECTSDLVFLDGFESADSRAWTLISEN